MKNVDLSCAGKGNVCHHYRLNCLKKLFFFAVHEKSRARYKRAWSMFNNVGDGDRTEIDFDSDDRASWIENGSPCRESPVQMARTRVAGFGKRFTTYLQHTCFFPFVLAVLMKFCHKIKCQPDSRQRAEEVPNLPATREC